MEEVLSRLLRNNFEEGQFGCFSHPVGAPLVTHLLYADDLLVFVNGGKHSVHRLIKTLEFPVTYLGVPLVEGRLTSRVLEPLIEKIQKKVAGWKLHLLSQGGRLTLIKHVLSCMTTHHLAVLNVPMKIFKKLNSLISTFFWGELNGKSRMKCCAWDRICKPYKEGGLGMRNFHEVQRSLHMKFAWRLLRIGSLWTKFFRVKYVKHSHIYLAEARSNSSRFWKSIMKVFPEVIENVIVKVREGSSSFWFDHWLASGPLCDSRDVEQSEIKKKKEEVWVDGTSDENRLVELVSLEKTEEIMHVIVAGKVGNGKDQLGMD
ncbi:hypothetical protein I3760_13G120400 [Carya illinoinensis]|nr:hypothetical protein I3760_13G120400 [Carya illinoinensis]